MAGSAWKSKAFYLMARNKQKKNRRNWGSSYPLQGYVPYDLRPPTRPHLSKFPLPPNMIKLETKPLICRPLGGPNSNYSTWYGILKLKQCEKGSPG